MPSQTTPKDTGAGMMTGARSLQGDRGEGGVRGQQGEGGEGGEAGKRGGGKEGGEGQGEEERRRNIRFVTGCR